MNKRFFYAISKKQQGPVTFEELQQLAIRGELKRQDKVWRHGMKEWQQAGSVTGLFDDLPPDLEPENASAVHSPGAPENGSAGQPSVPDTSRSLKRGFNRAIDGMISFLAPPEAPESLGLGQPNGNPVTEEQRPATSSNNSPVYPEGSVRKCTWCGHENASDAPSCAKCGGSESFITALARPNTSPSPAPTTQTKDQGAQWPTGVLARVAVSVLCLIFIIGGAYLLQTHRVGSMRSKASEETLVGTWQSVNGPSCTVTFESRGHLKMLTPRQAGVPFDMETTAASYQITSGKRFTVLMLGEYYDGEMIRGELAITSRRENVTQHFRRTSNENEGTVANEVPEQQNADLLSRVKVELATAGIPEVEANRAAQYIVARFNTAEPLTPEAAAQAQALGITPLSFSKSVIDEYSNWVQETISPAEPPSSSEILSPVVKQAMGIH